MPAARPRAPVARSRVAFAVAVGGAFGAAARYGIDVALPHQPSGFPVSTLLINVLGSAALGALLAVPRSRRAHPLLIPFLGGGVLGGFTTFSTYALQGYGLGDPADPVAAQLQVAVAYLVMTPVLAVAAAGLGAVLARRITDPGSVGRVR